MTREDALENLRWHVEEFTLKTPEQFKSARREEWVTPDTRNHVVTKHGMQREAQQTGEWWNVGDEHTDSLTPLLHGRTIATVERERSTDEGWPQGANTVTITLDDGSRLRFTGWGYDASGVNMDYSPAGVLSITK